MSNVRNDLRAEKVERTEEKLFLINYQHTLILYPVIEIGNENDLEQQN